MRDGLAMMLKILHTEMHVCEPDPIVFAKELLSLVLLLSLYPFNISLFA